MSDSDGVRRRSRPRSRGMRAKFDAPPEDARKGTRPAESCRIRIERDPGRAGGPYDVRPGSRGAGRAEEAPKVRKTWDPWAEDEPVFGDRERRHALSRHPGTPPCGNLAVQVPPGAGASSPQGRPAAPVAGGAPKDGAPGLTRALVALERPLRVEVELGSRGSWTFGLVERASRAGLEARLNGRSIGARLLVSPGRQVKVLLTPHDEPAFVFPAKVLWVDASPGADQALRVQLALATSSEVLLDRWARAVGKARGRPPAPASASPVEPRDA